MLLTVGVKIVLVIFMDGINGLAANYDSVNCDVFLLVVAIASFVLVCCAKLLWQFSGDDVCCIC